MSVILEQSENKITLSSPYHKIEFDIRCADKRYPIMCLMFNMKIDNNMIKELESSEFIKIDNDFNYYSKLFGDSSILFIPQYGFTTKKFINTLSAFLEMLECNFES